MAGSHREKARLFSLGSGPEQARNMRCKPTEAASEAAQSELVQGSTGKAELQLGPPDLRG